MFCRNCGKEVPDGQKFCDGCGAPMEAPAASQTPPPPPPPNYPPVNNQYPPAGGPPPQAGSGKPDKNTMDLVLKVVAGICAAFYAIMGLRQLFTILGSLSSVFYFYGFFKGIILLFVDILSVLVFVWMCAMLILLIVKRTPKSGGALFLGLCAGAVARLVVSVLTLLLLALFVGNMVYSVLGIFSFLGYVIVAGVVFLLLYLMDEAPFVGQGSKDVKTILQEGLADLKAPKPQQSAGGYQPSGNAGQGYAAPSGYAAPNPGAAASYAAQNPAGGGSGNAYQNAAPGYQNYGGNGGGYRPQPLKTDRSLVAYILLTIITCGIYSYYFLYCMARDVNVVCEGDGKSTPGLLPFILLSFVTCGFYALYWYYSLGNRLAANAPRYQLNFQENGTTILLWYLVGALLCGIGPYVAMHFLIRNTNSLCAAYNQYNGLYN